MDIEDTLNSNNLKKYYDFTKSFHNVYLNYPDLSFNRLMCLARTQNKSFKLNVNKMILRATFLQMVKENIVEEDKAFLKMLIKKPQRSSSDYHLDGLYMKKNILLPIIIRALLLIFGILIIYIIYKNKNNER